MNIELILSIISICISLFPFTLCLINYVLLGKYYKMVDYIVSIISTTMPYSNIESENKIIYSLSLESIIMKIYKERKFYFLYFPYYTKIRNYYKNSDTIINLIKKTRDFYSIEKNYNCDVLKEQELFLNFEGNELWSAICDTNKKWKNSINYNIKLVINDIYANEQVVEIFFSILKEDKLFTIFTIKNNLDINIEKTIKEQIQHFLNDEFKWEEKWDFLFLSKPEIYN